MAMRTTSERLRCLITSSRISKTGAGSVPWRLPRGNVDMVVAVSVDDRDDPKSGNVHLLDGDEMRERFDQAYKARLKAGQQIPLGRGVWLGLYRRYDGKRVRLVGAGAGLDHEAVPVVPLARADADDDSTTEHALPAVDRAAKRLLATSLGVEESSIRSR
jgi:hypothetical protein